ncbi:RNase A-like domain-containing protein [Enterobacter sp. DTU_2021_1002640_1_SI_PRY_ASU_LCPMC_013]|uniref:RNase A-like domain-containing protein n=1 Tax=Enterobacter sp. DTU_2021_1002640_1_SI_PRY_ASU_LCPMC_013 TaxID=3077940 RepID=UPI0028E74B12|nr:RNase A-like domain-containing protein [Enterobacter sp. DTU_2021_1002640_1_SI_PRY_ASU_LCPMC_013]WNU99480.1 RNase A-like domain-containing protein [Enterobacter sp. DTU_2021_1002640_1_SI_PRY_ASU_LCPMC_013]
MEGWDTVMEEGGMVVVMSPVQLAAVLSDKSITEAETLSNRLLGGLGVLLGAVEMAGATALCIAPEPTGLTKAGCVVVGAHSLDAVQSAARQLITGRDTRSATWQIAVSAARELGADEDTALNIGITVDIAVPLGFAAAIGAVRVAAIKAGRIKLIKHESVTGLKPGGHTLANHVGKTDSELLARFEKNKRLVMSSTFKDLNVAENVISRAVYLNRANIKSLLGGGKIGGRLTINYPAGQEVGYGFTRGSTQRISMRGVRIVIELQEYNGKPYYILTAFPTP